MQQCGFCSTVSSYFRRAVCVGSRRGSSESYYRELGEQETLKIEDRSSEISDDSEEISPEEPESLPRSCSDSELASMNNLQAGRLLTINKKKKKVLVTRSLITENGLLDDIYNSQVKCILNRSSEWKFNAFTLDTVSGGRPLPVLCFHLFDSYGLMEHFQLDALKIWKLFCAIEAGYHNSNPYHNAVHAADVTQAMHCFLQQAKIREYLEPMELMASLMAAIAHDLDHPGVNQQFLAATSNYLADLYDNISVLENHHWRSAVSCILESGLLEGRPETFSALVGQMRSLILATDITRQQEYLSLFKTFLDDEKIDMSVKEHRHMVLQIALKCADISNPCRIWDISHLWSQKVCEEFFRQGDYEEALSIPVTSLCDRRTSTIPNIQSGFFKFVVTPLITEWHRFLHTKLSQEMLRNLIYNQNRWDAMAAREQAVAESSTEITDADMVDYELETTSGTNISSSSEFLLPLRRSSLNIAKPIGLKEQLRRFSVPLNILQDKFKIKDKPRASSNAESHWYGTAQTLSPQLLIRRSSNDSIYKNESMIKEGKSIRLQKQEIEKTIGSFQVNFDEAEAGWILGNDKREPWSLPVSRRGSGAFGSQLRDNLNSVQLKAFTSDQMIRRRKSMPSNIIAYMPKEKRLREVAALFLRRTLSGKETWVYRRGSAPGAVATSEARGLAALRQSVGRKRPTPASSCQHWLGKSSDRVVPPLRRSSLPVEVLTGM